MEEFRYAQCELELEDGETEIAWIPIEFAKKDKNIILGKDKENGKRARVVDVWGKTSKDMAKYALDYMKFKYRTDMMRTRQGNRLPKKALV
jgi:hypothetical protein